MTAAMTASRQAVPCHGTACAASVSGVRLPLAPPSGLLRRRVGSTVGAGGVQRGAAGSSVCAAMAGWRPAALAPRWDAPFMASPPSGSVSASGAASASSALGSFLGCPLARLLRQAWRRRRCLSPSSAAAFLAARLRGFLAGLASSASAWSSSATASAGFASAGCGLRSGNSLHRRHHRRRQLLRLLRCRHRPRRQPGAASASATAAAALLARLAVCFAI